jgi:transcriptional regulator with XRE-family HTH domain/tetratricopeptide (TPR) repeat protein
MFGDVVQGHRRRLGLTQEELAAGIGVNTRTIGKIESGQIRRPRPSTVRLLADAFGLAGDDRAAFVAVDEDAVAVSGPGDMPDFSGRATEIDRIRGLVLNAALHPAVVAIEGLGGIGKTTLAARVAREVGAAFPDGCLTLDLRGSAPWPADPYACMASVMRSLGVAGPAVPVAPEALAAAYQRTLDGHRVLLVLDDAASAAQVRPLLPRTAGRAALVTSRHALDGLDGRSEVRLGPLAMDDAVAMLSRVVGAHREAAEPDAAARIVDLCGRLPLAIRIAATRIADQPETPLLRFAERLGMADRRLDERADREVRLILADAVERLEPRAHALLTRLGALPTREFSGWVAAVLLDAAPAEAEAALAGLVGASLASVGYHGAEKRYRLHDLVHLYARAHLTRGSAPGDLEPHLRRCYGALLTVAVAAERSDPDRAFPEPGEPAEAVAVPGIPVLATTDPSAWFDLEHGLLMGAVTDAMTRGWYEPAWRLLAATTGHAADRGLVDDWRSLVESVADQLAARDIEPAGEALLRLGLGGVLRGRGWVRDAAGHLRRARRLFRRVDDDARAGITALQLGMCARLTRQPTVGFAAVGWALARLDGRGLGQHRALAYIGLGNLHLDRGDRPAAHDAYRRALVELVDAPNRATEANVLMCLGTVCRHDPGRKAEAIGYFRRSLAMLIEIGDLVGITRVELALATVHLDAGDPDQAEVFVHRARRSAAEVGDAYAEGRARLIEARTALARRRRADAVVAFDAAATLMRRAGHTEAADDALRELDLARAG